MGMNNVTMFQNDRIGEEGPGLMMDVFTLPETLTEYLIHVAEEDKLGVLVALLEKYHVREKSDEVILVFCSSVVRTHRIHRFLSVAGFSSCEFSRNLSHRQRMSNMNALLREENTVKSNVVVATDVLGRGIDLSQKVSVVIQYDAPVDAKTYLHRCGRTARAKRSGIAITLADPACLEFMEHLRAQLKPDKILPLLDVDGDRKKLHTQMLTQALSTLQKVLEMEDSRNLQPTDPIPSNCVLNIFPSSADNASTAYGGDDAPTTRKQRPQRIDFQWICSICKYTNLPRNSDQCHRCTTPRNGTEKKYTGAMEKAMHGGMWKCKQCNARGLPRDLSCSKCHKTRTSFDPIMFFGPAILKRGPEESVAEDA
jgi:superfamily II DNA helicase RecQ